MAVEYKNCYGLLRLLRCCHFCRPSTIVAKLLISLALLLISTSAGVPPACQYQLAVPNFSKNSIWSYDVSVFRTGSGSGLPRPPPNLTHIALDEKTDTAFVASSRAVYRIFSNRSTTCRPIESIFESVRIVGKSDGRSDLRSQFCASEAASRTVNGDEENEIRVFEIDPNSRQLLICGVENCGLCAVADIDDNPDLEFHTFDMSEPTSYMGGDQLSKPFVLFRRAALEPTLVSAAAETRGSDEDRNRNGREKSSRSVLYVSGATLPTPEILSIRLLSKNDNISSTASSTPKLRYLKDAQSSRSSRPFANASFSSQFQRKYAFEDDGFVYFLLVHNETSDNSEAKPETRLARVCLGDDELLSYAEIELECMHMAGFRTNDIYVATTATTAPVGEDLAHRLHLSSGEERALYVVMGHGTNSRVCVYTMVDIRQEFVRNQQGCYLLGLGHQLAWINPARKKCDANPVVFGAIDEKFCQHPALLGLDSRYAFSRKANFSTYEHHITSIDVVLQSGKAVAIMGTENGHLLKVVIDGTSSSPFLEIDMAADMPWRPPVAMDTAFESDRKHIYVLAGPRISKVPVNQCRLYTTCDTCMAAAVNDPLGCGWCSGDVGECTTHAECPSRPWTNTSCPPVIESFYPKSGPLLGGTHITITGSKFGFRNRDEKAPSPVVSVDAIPCQIIDHNVSRIICRTNPSVMERSFELKVHVRDMSKSTVGFYINGTTINRDPDRFFLYRAPTVSAATPAIGPQSGGTLLTIRGKNLDVGSNRGVAVANRPCSLVSVTSEKITCIVSPANTSVQPSIAFASDSIVVTIDDNVFQNENLTFNYVDDPVVTSVNPHRGFISGGQNLTVSGTGFLAIQRPRISVAVAGHSDLFTEDCLKPESQTTLICLSPDLSALKTSSALKLDWPIRTHISFTMDGARNLVPAAGNQFSYFVDPVLHRWRDGKKYLYEDESLLYFKGENLNLAASYSDYVITIDRFPCNVTVLASTSLQCSYNRPQDDSLITLGIERAVQVQIGRLKFKIGTVKLLSGQWNEMLKLILIVAAVAAATFVSFVCVTCAVVNCRKNPKSAKKHPGKQTELNFNYVQTPSSTGNRGQHWPLVPSDEATATLTATGRCRALSFDFWNSVHDSSIIIPLSRLQMMDIIGQGHFGCVYRGILASEDNKSQTEVAVKTVKMRSDAAESNFTVEARQFLDEAVRMKEFDHVNVLCLIGVAIDYDNLPLVVLPYMRHGDLLSYIRNENNHPTVKQLINFATDIAKGMAYLSSLKFVHRDLAARNCMLDEDMQVKVADFGLSRDIYERDYYSCDNRKNKLPVKWMAPESLEKGIYNVKTDVWSFGIVLWELITRGLSPYPDVDNWDIFTFLKCGRRLSQPPYCPDAIYSIMMLCWHVDPRQRPPFQHLVATITDVISTIEAQQNRSMGDISGSMRSGPVAPAGRSVTSYRPSTSSAISDYLVPSPTPLNSILGLRSAPASVSSPVDVLSNDDEVWIVDEVCHTDDEVRSGRTASVSDDHCAASVTRDNDELTDSGVICGRGVSVSDSRQFDRSITALKPGLNRDSSEENWRQSSSAVRSEGEDDELLLQQQQLSMSWRCTTV